MTPACNSACARARARARADLSCRGGPPIAIVSVPAAHLLHLPSVCLALEPAKEAVQRRPRLRLQRPELPARGVLTVWATCLNLCDLKSTPHFSCNALLTTRITWTCCIGFGALEQSREALARGRIARATTTRRRNACVNRPPARRVPQAGDPRTASHPACMRQHVTYLAGQRTRAESVPRDRAGRSTAWLCSHRQRSARALDADEWAVWGRKKATGRAVWGRKNVGNTRDVPFGLYTVPALECPAA